MSARVPEIRYPPHHKKPSHLGLWDAALGNSELAWSPIDPRTNREMS